MIVFEFVSRWFWLLALLFSFQYLRDSPGLRERLAEDLEFATEHTRIRRKMTTLFTVPWLVMGVGQLVGGVETTWHFFRPQDLNPFVLAFFFSVVAVWMISVDWVFRQDGARVAAEHQLFEAHVFGKRKVISEGQVKRFAFLMILVGVFAICSMWFGDYQVPGSE